MCARGDRQTWCMKKILLIAAIAAGSVTASQAGVHLSIGLGIPVGPPVVYAPPAPVYAPPPPVCAPPPVVYAPPPPVVYTPPVVYSPPPAVYFGFGCGPRYWHHGGGWGYSHGRPHR
jgi:hypothetical protein